MARPKDSDLERTWRQRLVRQAGSGLSISAFAHCRRRFLHLVLCLESPTGRSRFPRTWSRPSLFRSNSTPIRS